ncbi:hypothetical protein LCGC14_2252580, partial [marine sediment metagenome]
PLHSDLTDTNQVQRLSGHPWPTTPPG